MEKLYYLTEASENIGPYTLAEIGNRKISKESLVWKKGNKDWLKAENIPELGVLFIIDNNVDIPPIPIRETKVSSNEVIKRIAIALVLAIIVKLISYDLIIANFGGRENMSSHNFSEANTVSYMMAFLGFFLVTVILYFTSKKK